MWNSKNSSVVGWSISSEEIASLHDVYEYLDTEELDKKATYILQFIWRDLTSDFDIVGPYLALAGSVECKFLHVFVSEAMLLFHKFQFSVRALLCDGASSNLSLIKLLSGFCDETQSSVPNHPWFVSPYDGQKVFMIICPSHQVSINYSHVHMYTCIFLLIQLCQMLLLYTAKKYDSCIE